MNSPAVTVCGRRCHIDEMGVPHDDGASINVENKTKPHRASLAGIQSKATITVGGKVTVIPAPAGNIEIKNGVIYRNGKPYVPSPASVSVETEV